MEIHSGSYQIVASPLVRQIQVYDATQGQSYEAKTRYVTSMLLTDLGLSECRLHLVSGVLNHEINEGVFNLAKALGYRRAQFEVPHGTKASRLAEFQYTHDGLDRYITNLE